ncbi:hypothetical protein GQX73_g9181 [Xylaria multiplex]|uniref:Hyphally-regulated cell wall protein N-terminal domain-containing protein n=1 Tax=Xylaria multiplex TaxID=323545 RepID=A0A7C8IIB7_9PEZI|nr:hypothetical protein GQX73_g9181 [Xylaria multiplex]
MKLFTALSVLPLLGGVLADCGVEGGTITLANPDFDILTELEACETIYGNILVDPGYVYFILDGGPLEITGTIIAHDNTILKYVRLQNATRIGGFSFANPEITGQVDFPEIAYIGNLEWINIVFGDDRGIDYFAWSAPKLVSVGSLNVEGTSLSGFKPDYPSYDGVSFYYGGLEQLQTAGNIRVVGNTRMDNVVFSGLKAVLGAIIVGDNLNYNGGFGKRDERSLLVSFPALETAGSIAVYDKNVPTRLSEDGKVDFPILGHVFGDFSITDIKGLTEVSVPALTDVDGGIKITLNQALKEVDFPELRRVGHVELVAEINLGFDKVSFPVLEEVGEFLVDSGANDFDCSTLEHIRAIATKFTCRNNGGYYNPGAPPITETPTPSSSSVATSPSGVPSPSIPSGLPYPADTSQYSSPPDTSSSSLAEPSSYLETNSDISPETTLETTLEPTSTGEAITTSVRITIGDSVISESQASTASTTGAAATTGSGNTPTSSDGAPTETESVPATGGASNMKSPIGIMVLLLGGWVL